MRATVTISAHSKFEIEVRLIKFSTLSWSFVEVRSLLVSCLQLLHKGLSFFYRGLHTDSPHLPHSPEHQVTGVTSSVSKI